MDSKNQIALQKIYKHHKEFVRTAKKLYGNNDSIKNYAEDYIQEVYLKLSKYEDLHDKVIKPDGTVSKGYIFFCLRSVIVNDLKKKWVIKYSHVGDLFDIEDQFTDLGPKSHELKERKAN